MKKSVATFTVDDPKRVPQVVFDGDAPRVAMFIWLDDGTCHQVQMNMSDRRVIGREILRKHAFCLKVAKATIALEWRVIPEDRNELEKK